MGSGLSRRAGAAVPVGTPPRVRHLEDRLLLALGAVVTVASVAALLSAVVALRPPAGPLAGPSAPPSAGPSTSVSDRVPAPVPPSAGTGAGATTGTTVDAADLAGRLARAAREQGSVALTLRGDGPRDVRGQGVARYEGVPADVAVTLRVAGASTTTVTTREAILFAPPRPIAGRDWIRMPRTGRTPLVERWDEVLDGVAEAAEPWTGWTEARVVDAGPAPDGRSAGGAAGRRYLVELAPEPGAALAPVVGADRRDPVTLELTLGADGLPLQAVYRTDAAGAPSSVTVRYSGWGRPVRIPEVPSSEVVEAETTDG